MKVFITIFTFFFASVWIIILDHFSVSQRSQETAIVLPLILVLFLAYRLFNKSSTYYEKLLFLFWGSICVQMLIIATGGFYSPFFIIIHLVMIGLSFFFSFSIAILFLGGAVCVLFTDIALHQSILSLLLQDPKTIILELISLLVLTPIVYIISDTYHKKDWFFASMRKRVIADEMILESLHELIIITDQNLYILSVNDAVERTILQSRSQLLYKSIFDVMFLKDTNGKLVSRESFFPKGKLESSNDMSKQFTLITNSTLQAKVTAQIQVIHDPDANISQVSFIFSFIEHVLEDENTSNRSIEKARTKYEALMEDIKKKLFEEKKYAIQSQLLLLEKIEYDTYVAQLLKKNTKPDVYSRIDVAKLCTRSVLLEKEFANAFQVALDFEIKNFGNKDIDPLIVKNFPVTPEDFTGPFFTVSCDIKRLEIIIKKLLEINIFFASTHPEGKVSLSVERGTDETITVTFISNCPQIVHNNVSDIFLPNYGKLYNKTNLSHGSGLEGYIIKTLTDTLSIPMNIRYKNNTVICTLPIKKNLSA